MGTKPSKRGLPKNSRTEKGNSAISSTSGDLILNSLPTVIIQKLIELIFIDGKKI
jgi:hypothetical protein